MSVPPPPSACCHCCCRWSVQTGPGGKRDVGAVVQIPIALPCVSRQCEIAHAYLNQPTSTLHFMMCLRQGGGGRGGGGGDVLRRRQRRRLGQVFASRSVARALCQLPIQKAYTTLMGNSYISIYSNKLCTEIIIFDKGAFCVRACSLRGWGARGMNDQPRRVRLRHASVRCLHTCIMDVGVYQQRTGCLTDLSAGGSLNRCGALRRRRTVYVCVCVCLCARVFVCDRLRLRGFCINPYLRPNTLIHKYRLEVMY